ncbi:MAG: SagB/ThcOx family dehydrogenase [Deltaproteobacteria bacterium]|nr:SagB/ThcOx family dehydrogenase [Deltaproteobacteria bacterium]
MAILGLMLASTPGLGAEVVKLPPPAHKGAMSVEEALKARRTVREFAARGLDLQQVSQLLWGADGLSDPRGHRTAASAGATYPLEIYLVAGEHGVADLPAGVYRYLVKEHALELGVKGDQRQAVARASLHQAWMTDAPVMVVIAADYGRCTGRYGERGIMYTHQESGHVGTNVFLQAEALGLGAGIVGAFEDKGLGQTLQLPKEQAPLLVMPVGYKH